MAAWAGVAREARAEAATMEDGLVAMADGAEAEDPAPRAVMGVEAVEETAQASLPQ